MSDKATLIARVVLGLPYVVFGLNGFFGFIQMPDMPAGAMAFMGALAATPYMIPLIKLTEIIGGAMVLTGRYSNLGLVLVAPITVNIVLFHIFLAPGFDAVALPLAMAVAQIYLFKQNQSSFSGVLEA